MVLDDIEVKNICYIGLILLRAASKKKWTRHPDGGPVGAGWPIFSGYRRL
jgi:hypothetical protein